MADSILVAVNKEQLKNPVEWNALLQAQGIDVSISKELNPISHIGYIGCLFEGKRTGFEYELDGIDLGDFSGELKETVSNKNTIISLTSRDGIKSALAASAIASAIAHISNSVIIDVDETVIDHGDALDWTRKIIKLYKDFEIKRSDAKKELRKLRKSEELIRSKLKMLISSLIGYVPLDGLKTGVYLGLVFSKGDERVSITTDSWEFGSNAGIIQLSKDLLVGEFGDEDKCAKFYPVMEKALDNCLIAESNLRSNNEITLKFDNGYYIKSFPDKTLDFSSNMFKFTLSPDSINVAA